MGLNEYTTACQVKNVSFFNSTHMHVYCVFALFCGIPIKKKRWHRHLRTERNHIVEKMKHSEDEEV